MPVEKVENNSGATKAPESGQGFVAPHNAIKPPSKKVLIAIVVVLALLIVGVAVNCSGITHGDGEARPPVSSYEAKGKNYQDIVTRFEKAGFTNVTAEPMADLILGLLNSEDAVQEISIDGDVKYDSGTWYPTDAKVIIRYHSFPERSSSSSESEGASGSSSASSSSSSASNSSSSSASAEADSTAQLKEQVKGYVGQQLIPVCDELKADGIAFNLIHEVTGMDMTSAYEYGDFNDGDMMVTAAKVNSNGSVILTIVSAELAAQAEEQESTESALTAKLSASAAWIAASDYGKAAYPYGFKLHYIVGVLAEEAQDENTWFLKAYCDVTNEYNAKAKNLTCEACVTGTEDNPEVTYFIVY